MELEEQMKAMLVELAGDHPTYSQEIVITAMLKAWGNGADVGSSNQSYADAYH